MRLLLIANYALDEQESMQRYAAMLAEGLRERGHEVEVLRPRPRIGRLGKRLPVSMAAVRKWLGYVDKFVLFPRALRTAALQAELVHICDHSNAMYVKSAGKRPVVVTCHDLLAVRCALGHFPEQETGWTGRRLQRWVAGGLRRADVVVCVSEKTRRDVQHVLGVPGERLRVAPNALHWDYRATGPQEREAVLQRLGCGGGRPYFAHVGANHWYKNRFAVLPIFAELRGHAEYRAARLVMAGAALPDEFRRWVSARGLEGDVIEVVGPTNEELRDLYSGAEALIFPSLEEGFGWPILEAQACGCPAAVADRPPMNEIAGPAGIRIDPADPAGAAAVIKRALSNREALREASLSNAARFERKGMLDMYESVYAELLQPRG
jgi:glycosyltransferase involved in cell wall biosynthesis